MARDYAALPANAVRRADRAVDDERWIADFLARSPIGYLATVHDGQPFINSNLFVYDAAHDCIFMHTARTGRTQSNVSADERVCFTTTEMGRLLPAPEALEFSVEYSGVVVFGRASIVQERDQQRYGLQLLMDKYFPHLKPGEDYRPIMDEELARTTVYRIQIESWSGKRKRVEDDFPGAFFYPHPAAAADTAERES